MIKTFWKKFALVYFAYLMVQILAVLVFVVSNFNVEHAMKPVVYVLFAPAIIAGATVVLPIANRFGNSATEDVLVLLIILAFFLNAAVYAFAIMGLRALWLRFKSRRATTNY